MSNYNLDEADKEARLDLHSSTGREWLYPTLSDYSGSGTRWTLMGMYDRMQQPGPITGSGPNFEKDIERFQQREKQRAQQEWRWWILKDG